MEEVEEEHKQEAAQGFTPACSCSLPQPQQCSSPPHSAGDCRGGSTIFRGLNLSGSKLYRNKLSCVGVLQGLTVFWGEFWLNLDVWEVFICVLMFGEFFGSISTFGPPYRHTMPNDFLR